MAGQRSDEPQRLHDVRVAARRMREFAAKARTEAIVARQRARAVVDMLAVDTTTPGREMVRAAFDALPTPAAIVNRRGVVVAANPPWRELFPRGLTVTSSFSKGWLELGGGPFVADALRQVLEGGAGTDVETPVPGARGRRGLVQIAPVSPTLGAALVVLLDITEQHQREQELFFDATHDDLTGLANRSWLTHQLAEALERRRRYGGDRIGLVYLDLDAFKPVNDTYGHAVGDELLREVAARWRRLVRAPDLLARVGGDEFVVLVPHLDDPHELAVLAERLVGALAEPFTVGPNTIRISVTAGFAEPPPDGSADDALAIADRAMYQAKRRAVRPRPRRPTRQGRTS